MQRFLLFIAFLFLASASNYAQTAQKGTHQAFVTEGITKIRLNIDPNSIEVRSTRSSRVLVEINVTISGSQPLLDYAIGTGRYNLVSDNSGGVLTISPVDRKQAIIIRGEEIEETITYVVYMPEHLEQSNVGEGVE